MSSITPEPVLPRTHIIVLDAMPNIDIPSPEASPQVIAQPWVDDPIYKYRTVKFVVGGIVFSVLQQWFLGQGTFKHLFDNWDEKTPIHLPDITVADFRAFLARLDPSTADCVFIQPEKDTLGVLKLSNEWKFTNIRNKAIDDLSAFVKDATPDVQISYGKQYLVQDWLRDGLQALIDDRTLTVEDLARPPYAFLHSDIARILYVQKEAAMKAWTCTNPSVGPAQRYRKHATALLEEVFKVDLDAAVYVEHIPSPSSGKVKQTPRKGASYSPYGASVSRRASGTTPRSARKNDQ